MLKSFLRLNAFAILRTNIDAVDVIWDGRSGSICFCRPNKYIQIIIVNI